MTTRAARRTLATLAVSLVAGTLAAGCSANPSIAPRPPRPPVVVHHGVEVLRCAGAAGPCAHGVALRVGEELRVVLQSTLWSIRVAGAHGVVSALGAAVVRPSEPCVAGGGCGTVIATFLARTPGTTSVLATRTRCGEAMGCTGKTGRIALHVVVRRVR
jgi:hypothetical protein